MSTVTNLSSEKSENLSDNQIASNFLDTLTPNLLADNKSLSSSETNQSPLVIISQNDKYSLVSTLSIFQSKLFRPYNDNYINKKCPLTIFDETHKFILFSLFANNDFGKTIGSDTLDLNILNEFVYNIPALINKMNDIRIESRLSSII